MRRIETDADVAAGVGALTALDPRFASVSGVGTVELRRRGPGFEGLAWIITGQMISLRAAEAIWGRTRAALGTVEAERLLELDEAVLREAGQSGAKVAAMRAAALAIVEGRLDLAGLDELEDEDAAASLMRVRGVGAWTAAMYLLSCEGRPDAWPSGDVALRTAAGAAFGLGRPALEMELREMSERWKPWRAIAARVLWAHYKQIAKLPKGQIARSEGSTGAR